ncbi:hypothetical protein ACLB1N_22400 [Escherichia coli]
MTYYRNNIAHMLVLPSLMADQYCHISLAATYPRSTSMRFTQC